MSGNRSATFRLTTSSLASFLAIPLALLLALLLYIGTTTGWLADGREAVMNKAGMTATTLFSMSEVDSSTLQGYMEGPLASLTPAPIVEPSE
ncbi:Uncharacterised protein [Slackia heliotrinireducens]|uniref:Uncharacterized protein n=1 Tax=Slackia heliotrinireducens (strain ATCC 29202 / DSM 20476 / NCTC 11029 / RHS 1) TaxID=471855 RepID=C7N6I4_SLAHD|nr:hypothetical protein [Slackia heliotrinireducens]ACV22519.1 hypothetical protein Shel_14990 [Slackia heliotrinireducens DSM 20476]VEH00953.1 Uncharacterised protein [Slackia heliotrinireducens]